MLHQVLCFFPFLMDIYVCFLVGFVYVFVSRVCLFWKFVPLYMVPSKK